MVQQTINGTISIKERTNYEDILEEFTIFLRNNITDRKDRTNEFTDTFTIDDSYQYELTNDLDNRNRHKVMNVKSVKVDGVEQTNYEDYVVGYRKTSPILGIVNFWNPPSGSELTVTYGAFYSMVFPESPRIDLSTNAYPRVTLKIDDNPNDAALGGGATSHEANITVSIADVTQDGVNSIKQQIKDLFTNVKVKKGFHNFRYIYLNSVLPGPIPFGEDPNDVVFFQQLVFRIPVDFEIG